MKMYPVEKLIACRVKKGGRFQTGQVVVELRKYEALNDPTTGRAGIDIAWSVWWQIVQAWDKVEAKLSESDAAGSDWEDLVLPFPVPGRVGLKSGDVIVRVLKYAGRPYVDIRDHFWPTRDRQEPTRRGVRLSRRGASQLKVLFGTLTADKRALDDEEKGVIGG